MILKRRDARKSLLVLFGNQLAVGNKCSCPYCRREALENMGLVIKLKVDPVDYVSHLRSPVGLYLKRELLKKDSKSSTILRQELYDKTLMGQSQDGSWNQLFVETANNLWNLALLGYDAEDSAVMKGLNWILSVQTHQYRGYPGFFRSSNREDPRRMRSTLYGEFGPGCTVFYQTAYAIHLLHLFGFDDDDRVETTVRSYLQFWTPTWCSAWCTVNVLRVLIEHPLSKESELVNSGLDYLAGLQEPKGAWKGFPFYHTFHALSRAKNDLARKQFEKAIPTVVGRQNRDGSWGAKARELDTFLVLDALKNAGLL